MASKCDSFIFSNLATPNVNKSCLHFVIDGSPFDLQYLLTSFANIEYKCDIYVYKLKESHKKKDGKCKKGENRLVNSCGLFCMNIQYLLFYAKFQFLFKLGMKLYWFVCSRVNKKRKKQSNDDHGCYCCFIASSIFIISNHIMCRIALIFNTATLCHIKITNFYIDRNMRTERLMHDIWFGHFGSSSPSLYWLFFLFSSSCPNFLV